MFWFQNSFSPHRLIILKTLGVISVLNLHLAGHASCVTCRF
uniref:Uncharacterized protein n=1 Tax=Anguilla anguilla TaxID=7936 RepID=A0A0E9TI86_ANGAN